MTQLSPEDAFDYVILGGGSAGCVLANRLSADPAVRVCLVEAGGEARSALIDVPIGIMALIGHPRLNWRSSSVPQSAAGNRAIYIPHGCVLGGGSSINGMVYMRGDALDYDGWAAAGNPGWSYAEVLPYFLRSENNSAWRSSPLHGTGGPLDVGDMRSVNPTADSFLEACAMLQIPRSDDFNVPHPIGAGYRQVTQRRGRRASTATAYLAPARSRANLTVITDATADRVLIADGRATGAVIRSSDMPRMLTARREVILTAGALGSPTILQRSGIGDPDHLAQAGVVPVRALPGVGSNLQDHNTAFVTHRTRSRVPYGVSPGGLPSLAWAGLAWLVARRGLLSSNASETAAFVRTSPALPYADLQLSFVSGRRAIGRRVADWGHGYGITAIGLRPHSRGSVRVRSGDVTERPDIDLGTFADERDLAVLVAGVRLGRRILETPAFARYGGREVAPGSDARDEAAIGDYIRRTSGTAFHPVGTCAMGRGADAVVDADLAVRGIAGLRVADASIMPTIVGGNTNAPVVMIAEKAADLITGTPPPPALAIAA